MPTDVKPKTPDAAPAAAAAPQTFPAAEAAGLTAEEVRAALAASNATLALVLQSQAKAIRLDDEARRLHEAFKAECSKSCLERTQEAADRLYQGPRRYPVGIPTERSHPVLLVNANSPEEARARYQALCGIRHTEHEIVAGAAGADRIPLPRRRVRRDQTEFVDAFAVAGVDHRGNFTGGGDPLYAMHHDD